MGSEKSPSTADVLASGLIGVRFAPSPTGHFHVGNFRTAWVSWTLAQALKEPWIIRIEDIDTARVQEDSWTNPVTGQLAEMKTLGLFPNQIHRQSERYARHAELFQKAMAEGTIYACDCSRSDVREALRTLASAPHVREPEYSGYCRARSPMRTLKPVETLAWRWKSPDPSGRFDQVIARTKPNGSAFQPGYHFACAVDDTDGGYRLLVRAWDLSSAEKTQKMIRSWVKPGAATRVYHAALVTGDTGVRLEKRTAGITLQELKNRGFTPEKLIKNFESTFEATQAITDIETAEQDAFHFPILGETRTSITLSELGICP